MKIIKLEKKHKRHLRTECRNCGTTVEEVESKLKWEHDRDGDLARETCPNAACAGPIFFYRK